MAAQDGANVLLAAGNGGGPETFAAIGGMRLTALQLANRPLEATNRESGAWRALAAATGARAVSISGRGWFTASAAEETLRGYAFAGSANNWRITFPAGNTLTGSFIVTAYSRSGEVGDEENFSLTLESAGALVYI